MWSDNTGCILLLNNTDLMETNDPKTFRVLYHLRTKHEKVLQSASCHKYILFICWNFGNFAVLLAVTGCRLMSTSPVFYLVKDFEVKIFNSYSFELQGYKLQWQKKHYNAEYINVIFQDSKKKVTFTICNFRLRSHTTALLNIPWEARTLTGVDRPTDEWHVIVAMLPNCTLTPCATHPKYCFSLVHCCMLVAWSATIRNNNDRSSHRYATMCSNNGAYRYTVV